MFCLIPLSINSKFTLLFDKLFVFLLNLYRTLFLQTILLSFFWKIFKIAFVFQKALGDSEELYPKNYSLSCFLSIETFLVHFFSDWFQNISSVNEKKFSLIFFKIWLFFSLFDWLGIKIFIILTNHNFC
jgi:hypothetical protein